MFGDKITLTFSLIFSVIVLGSIGVMPQSFGGVPSASEEIFLKSGNIIGLPSGQQDPLITRTTPGSIICDPSNQFPGVFAAIDFINADNGPSAFAVPLPGDPPWTTDISPLEAVPSDPNPLWVSSNSLGGAVCGDSTLYAIDFDINTNSIDMATLEFRGYSDQTFGDDNNEGVFVNGDPIVGSKGGQRSDPVHSLGPVDITSLVTPGTNTLYIYGFNEFAPTPAGIFFSAKITVIPTTTSVEFDFGDAPDSYGTKLASDGARHALGSGLFLGLGVDSELDSQVGMPLTFVGLSDDDDGNDDEDGVIQIGGAIPGRIAFVDITSSGEGILNAWFDFNIDGDFDDLGEQTFTNEPLTIGVNSLTFNVPTGIPTDELTFARYRVSSVGGLAPTGAAIDGEVEDYQAFAQADPSIDSDGDGVQDDQDPAPNDPCNPNPSSPACTTPSLPVGGEMIPLDTTTLLLAGSQMTASWLIPVIVSSVGIGLVLVRKRN